MSTDRRESERENQQENDKNRIVLGNSNFIKLLSVSKGNLGSQAPSMDTEIKQTLVVRYTKLISSYVLGLSTISGSLSEDSAKMFFYNKSPKLKDAYLRILSVAERVQ